MPETSRTRGITFKGEFGNVRVIGGAIKRSGSTEALVRSSEGTNSIFVEGLLLDGGGINEDGIDVAGGRSPKETRPDVYLQNIYIKGLHGTFTSPIHADMYQPQNPIGTLYVDKFTGYSQYQGFFIRPQYHITAAYLSRVDLNYEEGGEDPTYLLWFGVATPKGEAEPIYPVYLDQVYVTPRPGDKLARDCVWPKEGLKREGVDVGAEEFKLEGRNAVRWPPAAQIHGYVIEGPPPVPGGHFVSEKEVGLGYVSPGYAPPPSEQPTTAALGNVTTTATITVPSFTTAEVGGW